MFIVNQDSTMCFEVKEFWISETYPDNIKNEIDAITERIRKCAYNYGSTAKAEEAIARETEQYLINKPCEYNIYVNNCKFAVYTNKDRAFGAYKKGLRYIEEGQLIYRLE